MTSNMDEFDQDHFDPSEPLASSGAQQSRGGAASGFMDAWRNKPIFKLVVIMIGVGAALALVLGTVTPDRKPVESEIGKAPKLVEAPGGTASPFFIEQNKQANLERADSAMQAGGSALPTPVGHDMTDLMNKNKKDPLVEFREETERLKHELRSEQAQNAQRMQAMKDEITAQNMKRGIENDDSLARAMQKQMEALMESWNPRKGAVIKGYGEDVAKEEKEEAAKFAAAEEREFNQISQVESNDKVIVPSGTVNYVQLLTEANSDIPGPILAQILSGPLSGGRAIGRFAVQSDYLVMTFSTVSLRGKEYSINALALDPDTTLGGMASEVDHRYFSRVLLPAAGAFVQAFGQALSETDTTTTVTDGSVLQDKAKKGSKEALYSGLGQAGQTMSQFFQNEANNIKTLVRVAVGTPMGLFFTQPVMSSGRGSGRSSSADAMDEMPSSSQNASVPYPKKDPMASAYSGMPPAQAAMLQNMMTMMQQQSAPVPATTTRR